MIAGMAAAAQAPVPNFSAINVATGNSVSLNDYVSKPGIVLFFTSNNCPFDTYYRTRIKALVAEYQSKVQFLFVNSYLEPEENANAMKIAYSTWEVEIPYLADKDQVALRALDARKSPDAFLLKSSKSGFTIFYSGSIDDSPQVAAGVQKSFLKDAINELLNGAAPVPSKRSVGCTIRRKN